MPRRALGAAETLTNVVAKAGNPALFRLGDGLSKLGAAQLPIVLPAWRSFARWCWWNSA